MAQALDYSNASLRALSKQSRQLLSEMLNSEKILLSESGYERDWRGLASLTGLTFDKMSALMKDPDPIAKILMYWENNHKDASMQHLIDHLETIDRFDVLEDITEYLEKDVKNYVPPTCNGEVIKLADLQPEDVLLPRYDAFILYAQEDLGFATEVISTLEERYDFKICAQDRDLIIGHFQHSEVIKIMAERCNHVILIFSPEFFTSEALKFYSSFAQGLTIEQRTLKIIPVVYKQCIIPKDLVLYTSIKRDSQLYNFWEKLRDSIRQPIHHHQNIKRSISSQSAEHHQKSMTATTTTECGIKPKKHSVKFRSEQDLPCNGDSTGGPQTAPLTLTTTTPSVETSSALGSPTTPDGPSISPNSSSVNLNEMDKASAESAAKKSSTKTTFLKKILLRKEQHSKVPSTNNASDAAADDSSSTTNNKDTVRVKEKKHFWSRNKSSKVAVAI